MTVFQPLFQRLYHERVVSVLSKSICLFIDRVDFLFWIFFPSFCTAYSFHWRAAEMDAGWGEAMYIDQDVDMETRL